MTLFLPSYLGDEPSFLELVAQDRLMDSLRPVLRYALRTAAQHFPALPILHSAAEATDELFYLLLHSLERHSLRVYDASFAENYFGLKRVRLRRRAAAGGGAGGAAQGVLGGSAEAGHAVSSSVDAVETDAALQSGLGSRSEAHGVPAPAALSLDGQQDDDDAASVLPIGDRDRRMALVFLVAVPYVRSKLEAFYESLVNPTTADGFENLDVFDPATEHRRPKLIRWWRWLVYHCFPTFHFALEMVLWVYKVRYLFGFSPFFSPFLELLGQKLARLSYQDMMRQQGRQSSSVINMFRFALLLAVFVFNFMQWWYTARNEVGGGSGHNAPPPPPEQSRPHPDGLRLPSDKRKCPICRQKRTNATATPAGFVFCYRCVFDHVEEHGRCPVSRLPCETGQLRKLFES